MPKECVKNNIKKIGGGGAICYSPKWVSLFLCVEICESPLKGLNKPQRNTEHLMNTI